MSPAAGRRIRALVLLGVSVATTIGTVADLNWPGRPLLALAFFLLVPGVAVVAHLGLDDALAEVTVGAALSIAIGTLVALLMIWSHLWNPAVAQVLLALATAPLLVAQARRAPDGALA